MRVMRAALVFGACMALLACSGEAESSFVVPSDGERETSATAFLDDEIGDQSHQDRLHTDDRQRGGQNQRLNESLRSVQEAVQNEARAEQNAAEHHQPAERPEDPDRRDR